MPQNRKQVRLRLQSAALELFQAQGYEQTTALEIAARAGVTERTFFRHFADKREVLFDGEAALSTILTEAMRDAPSALGPWPTLLRAFRATLPLLIANRSLSEPRRRVIASNPPLQERELAKVSALTAQLADALRERGVAARAASLVAQMGMVAFSQAMLAWLDGEPGELDEHLAHAFREVHDLSSLA